MNKKFKSIFPTIPFLLVIFCGFLSGCASSTLRATGDLGVIIERAQGSVQIVEHSNNTSLAAIDGLGDLSHASLVYSRDERYAYVFGRDGGLSKIDLLENKLVDRVIQSGNSIGGAISQDGSMVAVSNYEPGGVRVFDATTLDMIADIPAIGSNGELSKVIGLVDVPGNGFVFSLFDAGEIWTLDMSDRKSPQLEKFTEVGKFPYDALITPDGRYYIAGLFGEDGLAVLDLWNTESGVKRVLDDYGRGDKKMPVYKMPHLEGWAVAGNKAFVPAVGRNQVLVVDMNTWEHIGSIPVHGQPVFVMARPDGRQVWVNFAFPRNDTLQIIDSESQAVIKEMKPGKAVLHMEFTPRGESIWVSVRDEDRVDVYNTRTFEKQSELAAQKPSGIFFTSRAHKTGL